MTTEEEYLDNLLNALENDGKANQEKKTGPREITGPERETDSEAAVPGKNELKSQRRRIAPQESTDMMDGIDEKLLEQAGGKPLGEEPMAEIWDNLLAAFPEETKATDDSAAKSEESKDDLWDTTGKFSEKVDQLATSEKFFGIDDVMALLGQESDVKSDQEIKSGQAEPQQQAEIKSGQAEPQQAEIKSGQAEPQQQAEIKSGQAEPQQQAEIKSGQAEPQQQAEIKSGQAEPQQAKPQQQAETETRQADADDTDYSMEEDADISDIKDLLDKAENNDPDDEMMALLSGSGISEYGQNSEPGDNDDILSFLNDETAEEASDKDQKKKKSKKKSKKKGAKEEREEISLDKFGELTQDTEKKGFFKNLFSALTDTDEEDESLNLGENIKTISDENQGILTELEREDKKGAKGKKPKKKGKKSPLGDEETSESEDQSDGKPVKASKKKAKKEKQKTEDIVPKKKEKKISKRKILLVFVFSVTLTAAIVAICRFLPDYLERAAARTAYLNKDYTKVYSLFYGKNLSKSDARLYNGAFMVLQMERKEESYRNYLKMSMRTPEKDLHVLLQGEALHALLQGVAQYQRLNAEDLYEVDDDEQKEVSEIYKRILEILRLEYNIDDEQKALDILAYDNTAYAEKVYSIALGIDFTKQEGMEESEISAQSQDVLPEEEDFIP